MLPLIMLLWYWTGYVIGFVTFVATHPSAVASAEEALVDTTYLDPALFERALIHAKTMAVTDDPRKVRRAKTSDSAAVAYLAINFTLTYANKSFHPRSIKSYLTNCRKGA